MLNDKNRDDAESHLDEAWIGGSGDFRRDMLQSANVHATLALASEVRKLRWFIVMISLIIIIGVLIL